MIVRRIRRIFVLSGFLRKWRQVCRKRVTLWIIPARSSAYRSNVSSCLKPEWSSTSHLGSRWPRSQKTPVCSSRYATRRPSVVPARSSFHGSRFKRSRRGRYRTFPAFVVLLLVISLCQGTYTYYTNDIVTRLFSVPPQPPPSSTLVVDAQWNAIRPSRWSSAASRCTLSEGSFLRERSSGRPEIKNFERGQKSPGQPGTCSFTLDEHARIFFLLSASLSSSFRSSPRRAWRFFDVFPGPSIPRSCRYRIPALPLQSSIYDLYPRWWLARSLARRWSGYARVSDQFPRASGKATAPKDGRNQNAVWTRHPRAFARITQQIESSAQEDAEKRAIAREIGLKYRENKSTDGRARWQRPRSCKMCVSSANVEEHGCM